MLMLNRAYGAGDLSLVYPIARGVAPLAVAVVSISILGENLSYANQGAVLLIGLGITSLALVQRPTRLMDLRPFLFALATGAFIAAYTIVDGLGARVAGSAHGYVIWLSLVTSLLIVNSVQWLQQGRSLPVRAADEGRRHRCWHHELRIVVGRHLGSDAGPAGTRLRASRDRDGLCSDHRCRSAQGTSKLIAIGLSRGDPAWH